MFARLHAVTVTRGRSSPRSNRCSPSLISFRASRHESLVHFVLLFLDHFVKLALLRVMTFQNRLQLDFKVLLSFTKAFLLLQQEFLSFFTDPVGRFRGHIGQVTEFSLQLVILIL